jgi:hypothetical protein
MSLTTSNFTIEQLESRFEMQCMSDTNQFYQQEQIVADGGTCGGGASYEYYGSSWINPNTPEEGYGGAYQGDGSGNAQLDDGTYTDQSSGSFPAWVRRNVSVNSFCRVCRCRF